MGLESDDDRLAMVDDHESAIWMSDAGTVRTILGLFDRPYLGQELGSVEQDNREPTFLCRTCDIPTAAPGDTLIADGVTFAIVGVEVDGQGMTLLVLASG